MIMHINESLFIDRFEQAGRKEQFSYAGLRALFEYLESLEDDTGQPIELDVIALCCDFTECAVADVEHETGVSIEDLGNHTIVIPVDDETIIYQTF